MQFAAFALLLSLWRAEGRKANTQGFFCYISQTSNMQRAYYGTICTFLNAAPARRAILCTAAFFCSQTCCVSNGLLIFFFSFFSFHALCVYCFKYLYLLSKTGHPRGLRKHKSLNLCRKKHLHAMVLASESNLITYLAVPLCKCFTWQRSVWRNKEQIRPVEEKRETKMANVWHQTAAYWVIYSYTKYLSALFVYTCWL